MLNTLLEEVGVRHIGNLALAHVKQALAVLARPYVLPILAAALLIPIFSRSWRAAIIGGCLSLFIIVLLGLLGRPAILRVYYPMLALLMLMPLMHVAKAQFLLTVTLLLAGTALAAINTALADHRKVNQLDKSDFSELAQLQGRPLYVWGGEFPFELAYPPAKQPLRDNPIRIYGFGVFTPAPISVARKEVAEGRSFIAILTSPMGADLIATAENLTILSTYCREHELGTLEIRETGLIAGKPLRHVLCRGEA